MSDYANGKPDKPDDPYKTSNGFLSSVQLPIIESRADPLVARLLDSISGKVPIPATHLDHNIIDGITTVPPDNLRVTFILQQMENEIVSGGGVDAQCWATWRIESPVTLLVASGGGPFELPAPGAGETWPITHGSAIYDALVINGCGSTSVFPVELRSTVGEQANAFSEFNQIGEFMGADDSTLQPNGFWTFAYEIRATGTNGGVSDFKFRGLVRITCSNLTAFPS